MDASIFNSLVYAFSGRHRTMKLDKLFLIVCFEKPAIAEFTLEN
jgi:hypothetical protein